MREEEVVNDMLYFILSFSSVIILPESKDEGYTFINV